MEPGTTLVNWQQAFEGYRIPQTRAIEKQLRSSAAQNKEKLRTLVGGSYRELLATAQAIVVLDEQTRSAEDHLSSIGHNCRPPQLDANLRPPPADRVALAQYRLLQRCCTTIALCLRDDKLLLSARLMVVSRLLLKSLNDQEATAKCLDFLRGRLTSLRRQLLLRVDSKLNNPTSKLPALLESICSYCLVTSSSADDALAHLRHLRLEKIRRRLTASRQPSAICEALRYQLSSLQSFRSLIGLPIIEAMNELQRRPILADPSIRNLETLDFDRIALLIPDDIRSFAPYFRRSAPTSEELQSKFESWSQDACRALSEALRQYLSEMSHVSEVLELRKRLYTLLLPSYFSTPAGSYLKEQMAQAINEKVSVVCRMQGAQLDKSTDLLLQKETRGEPALLLWDEEIALAGLDAGGNTLIRQVRKRHAGHNGALSKASRTLTRWLSTANATLNQLDAVSDTRWRDILEEPDEDDEVEAADLITELGETDPKLYKETLAVSLREAVLRHESRIAEAAARILNEKSDISYIVASLRSIRLSISSLKHVSPEHFKFDRFRDIVPRLQQTLANEVAEQLSWRLRSGDRAGKWDTTFLPDNMPSPRAFSTLRHLCRIMLDLGGTDLWSPPLVALVKEAVRLRIFTSEVKPGYMHTDFDEVYLGIALDRDHAEFAQDVSNRKELVRSAAEYWTRTKLLFGVLA
ncbi:hypothetical protein G647_05485 [Cladophialophora carrionii CBS 160.54]|uniref:Conserved oligomeric Golgi complex subunit 1 n=1 Tax=Cladophialophora carrionii CBS 160.54 TaxID=1279043 RepID=V9DCI0_9EURO|nr:uncharacterized protein G647_05485 [Cladophialophora carrionii CBS 160.54]ETI23682.1 hypothetical protein G647_05485 [Cladophialophora carrionii CBS 160.54]